MATDHRDLFTAIGRGELEGVQKYLSDASVWNCIDAETGETPLTAAATVGHYGILRFLLQIGADRTVPNSRGQTAYQILFEARKTILMKLFSTF